MRAFINRLRLAISTAIAPAWADKVNREVEQRSTLTLSKQSDAMNFWPGIQVEASANDGSNPSDALRSGGTVGYLTVGSVNRDLGTVTFTDLTGLRAFIDRLRLAISTAIAPAWADKVNRDLDYLRRTDAARDAELRAAIKDVVADLVEDELQLQRDKATAL